jgi:hypothetical protein
LRASSDGSSPGCHCHPPADVSPGGPPRPTTTSHRPRRLCKLSVVFPIGESAPHAGVGVVSRVLPWIWWEERPPPSNFQAPRHPFPTSSCHIETRPRVQAVGEVELSHGSNVPILYSDQATSPLCRRRDSMARTLRGSSDPRRP